MKTALVTGITGQDGAYLAELLLDKGYQVHGLVRRTSLPNTGRLKQLDILSKVTLHPGDMTDAGSLAAVVGRVRPDEIYNLAAQSHVRESFDCPEYTGDCTGLGVVRLLEALRLHGLAGRTRFYQASTSELFGQCGNGSQNEATPMQPCSPYAVAKLYGYWITRTYREAFGMFACNGILFNHESPLRGVGFVTRKITQGLMRIKMGRQDTLALGNLDAQRDWGHARDYVEMMWLMLQQAAPRDFVVATGHQHSVREFVLAAARELGMELRFEGQALEERGVCCRTGSVIVTVDPTLFRPNEVEATLGDAALAAEIMGWRPKTGFQDLVKEMVAQDLECARTGAPVDRSAAAMLNSRGEDMPSANSGPGL